MRLLHESTRCLVDQDESGSPGGAAYLNDIERRLAPYFERPEPRQRALADLRGLLSPAERKNSWQLAEVSVNDTPYGFQYMLRRALWDPEAIRDKLHTFVIQHLGALYAVLVLDETGFLKKGATRSARSGTARRLGQALLDRDLDLPRAWTDDTARCRQAGVPADRRCSTKPQLARQTLQRALAAGVPPRWVSGDSVYGEDRRLRLGWKPNR
jgi:SRSO17 transposase